MYLDSLKAVNFRNYDKLDLNFSPDLNILYGDNAQGKTNLIEAISVLALGRSFRTNKDEELIKRGELSFYLKGLFKRTDFSELSVEIGKSKEENLIKLDGIPCKRRKDVFGHVKMVIFSPEDLQLIKGGPGFRRQYLDLYIGQVYPGYRVASQKYYRALFQRNALLKKVKNRERTDSSLEAWTEKLVEEGSKVLYYRLKVLREIESWVREYHRRISGNKEEIDCIYEWSGVDRTSTIEQIKNVLYLDLKNKKSDEFRKGITLIGPHRDDISILLNKELDIRNFGSQGQQRTAALALKMAMIDLIKKTTEEKPILLLDDVFSEFDNERKKELLVALIKKTQTFITTANAKEIKDLAPSASQFWVEGGKIYKKDDLST
ncbi:MAG TPA: DNA replication/repair protein RecF [Bacillota bacterium]